MKIDFYRWPSRHWGARITRGAVPSSSGVTFMRSGLVVDLGRRTVAVTLRRAANARKDDLFQRTADGDAEAFAALFGTMGTPTKRHP